MPMPSPKPHLHPKQVAKCEQVQARQRELDQMEDLVEQTFGQIEGERQRALLLVSNFDPGLAAQIEREFDE